MLNCLDNLINVTYDGLGLRFKRREEGGNGFCVTSGFISYHGVSKVVNGHAQQLWWCYCPNSNFLFLQHNNNH